MPYGCGTWPAWWSNGPNWPAGGEIDVVEGVNNQVTNQMTLHTSDSGCKYDPNANITGTMYKTNDDCNANVNGNAGCSFFDSSDSSYGQPFNAHNGGVWAT
ncbi:hypothetical protein T439DRAFT_356286 [Meredithblackwellia eburnea MCA 4105]